MSQLTHELHGSIEPAVAQLEEEAIEQIEIATQKLLEDPHLNQMHRSNVTIKDNS